MMVNMNTMGRKAKGGGGRRGMGGSSSSPKIWKNLCGNQVPCFARTLGSLGGVSLSESVSIWGWSWDSLEGVKTDHTPPSLSAPSVTTKLNELGVFELLPLYVATQFRQFLGGAFIWCGGGVIMWVLLGWCCCLLGASCEYSHTLRATFRGLPNLRGWGSLQSVARWLGFGVLAFALHILYYIGLAWLRVLSWVFGLLSWVWWCRFAFVVSLVWVSVSFRGLVCAWWCGFARPSAVSDPRNRPLKNCLLCEYLIICSVCGCGWVWWWLVGGGSWCRFITRLLYIIVVLVLSRWPVGLCI